MNEILLKIYIEFLIIYIGKTDCSECEINHFPFQVRNREGSGTWNAGNDRTV